MLKVPASRFREGAWHWPLGGALELAEQVYRRRFRPYEHPRPIICDSGNFPSEVESQSLEDQIAFGLEPPFSSEQALARDRRSEERWMTRDGVKLLEGRERFSRFLDWSEGRRSTW
ncbi:hypothetical protein [Archangium sp. Cb G35]|uniref:hypothetical protein n=1 Tax=Archangium sp. Cb G35 TaxID=1920190 RepID=UPI0013010794|nr:hypothetical protein [Archangium sp. Cb G35]